MLARVASPEGQDKTRDGGLGVGWGEAASVLFGAAAGVASVAENISSGHASLLSNPITPCGWAPKIVPVSPIITVQRFHHRPLIVPWTQASLTPPLPASQGHLG